MKTTAHSASVYWKTFGGLLLLLALTWSVGYVDLGPLNLIVALAVAMAKAILVVLLFMHIRGSNRLLHLAAAGGVLWLFILLTLTFADYITRH